MPKKCVTKMVTWPLLRPDIFQDCRSPGKGLLLFGPPISQSDLFFVLYMLEIHFCL